MSAPTSNNSGQKEQAPPPIIPSDGKVETSVEDVKNENAIANPSTKNNEIKSETISKDGEKSAAKTSEIQTKSDEKVNDAPETKPADLIKTEDKKESLKDPKTEQKPTVDTETKVESKKEEKSDVNKNQEANSEVKVNDESKLNEETKIKIGDSTAEKKKAEHVPSEDILKDKIAEEVKVEPKPNETAPSSEVITDLNAGANIGQVESTKEPNSANETGKVCEKKEEQPGETKATPAETNQLPLPQTEPESSSIETTEGGPEKEDENAPQEECIDIQELSEHVMNIINEGVANENASRDDLLKRNLDLQQFIVKLIHLLKEKTDLSINLDRQNSALISQAKSLKDVISITKDLLGIRNMEVEHLQADLDSMQEAIKAERNRHNTAVQHLTEAMGLNDKLKSEYLTQMDLFEKLKEKYTEKVVILTRENIRLTTLMQQNGLDTSVAVNESPEPVQSNPDPNQPESVDK